MKIGIIGMANSGKTTIFNALSGQEAEVTSYANTKTEPNLAVVEVADNRITQLSALYEPKKTIYANIELIDFAGLSAGSAKSGLFSPEAMTLIKNTDAMAIVLQNFTDELDERANIKADCASLNEELILTDLIIAEKRLEKIKLSYKRGQKTPALQIEEKAIEKIIACLEDSQAIRSLDFPVEEAKAIRGFQFLSQKPLMIIINSDEDSFGNAGELIESLAVYGKVIEFAGKFEMELSRLDAEEAQMFMEDMGINGSAKERLTLAAYELLGYISFFTVGKDEVRAWTIRKNSNAVVAAGAIHSDLARGFIRAECYGYDDIMEHGSEKILKEKGLFRLEGKTYLVQDGDILSIRFNV